MKKIFMLLFIALTMTVALSAQPRFWTWTGGGVDKDWDVYFAELNDVGITGVLIGTSREVYEHIIPIADKYEVKIQAWLWIMANGGIAKEHPQWLDYNRRGESIKDKKAYVDYYKFLNPIIPGVQDAIVEYISSIASIEGLEGISLDYCRFVDVILPTSLWPNYNVVQDKVYPEWDYGYHPDMIDAFKNKYGYSPLDNVKENEAEKGVRMDKKWHQFRMDQVNNLVAKLVDVAHSNGKKISASPFPTPKMSRRMVYQDWGAWELDMAFPMIYNGFYYGDIKWIQKCVKECIKDSKCPENIYIGLFTPDFKKEGDFTLIEAIQAAMDAGAKGFSLFQYEYLSSKQKQELKEFISVFKN